MRIGSERVSTRDQHPEAQRARLLDAGCERVYCDHGVSGMKASRPEWDRCLDALREGDVLVVVRLDRIGRSVRHLVDVVGELERRGVDLVAIDQALDTSSPAGKLMFHVIAAIAQFERDLIVERTMDGLAAARAQGRKGGAKPKLNSAQAKAAREMRAAGKPIPEILRVLPVSRATLYRYLAEPESIAS